MKFLHKKTGNPLKGTTFVELLLYIAIFLIITPILLVVSIHSLDTNRQYNIEKDVNADSQFAAERIYDMIVDAKRVNVLDSRLNDEYGRLSLVLQDGSTAIIELNEDTKAIEITENGETDNLTSSGNQVEQLYFEKILDDIDDPEIALGINVRIKSAGLEDKSVTQDYVLSANLDKGDFDDDGCPDFIDRFPRHSECCGDADNDGTCDEMDNCVMEYNPFQEDYDGDLIGDACDASVFINDEGGGEGEGEGEGEGPSGGLGGSAFNCSPDQQLLDLIHQEPPLPSDTLKQILLSSSPLPPTVLQALIDEHPLLTNSHFRQVFLANLKLPSEIRSAVSSMSTLPFLDKLIILAADTLAQFIPWLGWDNNEYTIYEITFISDAGEGEDWVNRINYHNADYPLCSETATQKTDIFIIDVLNGTDSVGVTTQTDSLTTSNVLTNGEPYIVDDNGFSIEINDHVGNSYVILASGTDCTEQLDAIEFDFGPGADIYKPSPTKTSYSAKRYISYCEGGCATGCGDAGTGIVTTNVSTDRCYRWNDIFPEWCSHWFTSRDDNSENPAFVGGTQIGEDSVYWEKTFQSILTQLQLDNLESITVAGEVAYQSITQFFCDTLESSCPMNATLVGPQNVDLFDYATDEWVTIGELNLDGSISDQQAFEVLYDGADVKDFFSPGVDQKIKARMEFNWDGVAPGEETSAPAFMLIDFFTVHLKW